MAPSPLNPNQALGKNPETPVLAPWSWIEILRLLLLERLLEIIWFHKSPIPYLSRGRKTEAKRESLTQVHKMSQEQTWVLNTCFPLSLPKAFS